MSMCALDFKIGNRADAAMSYAPSGGQYVSRDQCGAPTDRERLASAADCPTWNTAASSFLRLSRTTPSSSLPELVRPTWRVVRPNRRNPSWGFQLSNQNAQPGVLAKLVPDGVMYSAVQCFRGMREASMLRHKRETSKPAGRIPLLRAPQQLLKYLNLYTTGLHELKCCSGCLSGGDKRARWIHEPLTLHFPGKQSAEFISVSKRCFRHQSGCSTI